MNIKRILLLFAILFQLLAVGEVYDYEGPVFVEYRQSVFDRDLETLASRAPALHKE